jgi:hypothetical protein
VGGAAPVQASGWGCVGYNLRGRVPLPLVIRHWDYEGEQEARVG